MKENRSVCWFGLFKYVSMEGHWLSYLLIFQMCVIFWIWLNGGLDMGILIGIIVLLFGYLSYVLFNPEKF